MICLSRLGRFHLHRPALRGPAERVLIEIWPTGLTGLALNGYPEPPAGPVRRWSMRPYRAMRYLAPVPRKPAPAGRARAA